MAPILVRPFEEADRSALRDVSARALETLRQVYRPTQSAIDAKHERRATRHTLVATSDGVLVGYLEYETRADALRLLGPMVDPNRRRSGVARALVAHLIDIARAAGIRTLSLVAIEQTGNVEVFERLGFHVTSRATPADLISVSGAALVEAEMEQSVG